MPSTPVAANAISGRQSIPLLLALIAAGLAGNHFNFQIFLDMDFLFGSIFALLALQFLGPGRGTLAAAVIAGYTFFTWNHPYAVLIMTAEVAVVGWLTYRRKMGLVLADALYWLVVGMPLVYLFYHVVMQVPFSNTFIVMTKQAVNGIANALAARLIFTGYMLRSRSKRTSYHDVVYNLMAFFALCPALILLAVSSRADFAETDLRIRTQLRHDSRHADQNLVTWVANRKSAILTLAQMSATRSPQQMQPYLELERRSDVNFQRVGLLDREATITAYSPLLDEQGKKNVGKSYADRPFLPRLKQTLKPMLSEVVMGRIDTDKPIVLMLAPVVVRGAYGGYVAGTLGLEQVRVHLDEASTPNASLYSLIDKNGNVIMTNRSDQRVMTPFVRGKGILRHLDPGIGQWIPALPSNTPTAERWKKSLYVAEISIGNLAEWKLILEQPVAPFQKSLYDNYTRKLTLLLSILFAALVLAELCSRRIVATLQQLSWLTHELPARLTTDGKGIAWPESGLEEADSLIRNFREMADSLTARFSEVRQINATLEQRVNERTDQLAGITYELNLILENVPVGVYKNIDRKWVWANRRVDEMFQYSKEEIDLHTVRKLYPSDEAYEKIGQEAYPALARGQAFEAVQELIRKDGVHRQIRCFGKAVAPPDMSKGTIWLLEDVTERLRFEEALLEANQFSAQVIKSVQEGVIVYDGDLRYRVWNPFMEQMSGMKAEEVLGRYPSELFPLVQDSGLIERLKKVLEGETPDGIDFPYSFPTTGKSGWTSQLSAPLRNSKGEIVGVIATAREITWRKRMEDELRQALETAKSANVAMSRLLSTVAHEFRTPLGLLTCSTDILDRYWDRLTPGKRLEQNVQIRSAARQMSNLINSVISFNRLEAENHQNHPLLLGVRGTCRIIAAEVETVWSAGHTFIVSIAADCGTAPLDEILFRRVLENLLTNAFRYTPPDGTVSLRVRRERNRLLMEVADTGIGIPEEDRALIFEAFYRSRNVEGRRGLGLGLSIVHESLSQMGATITITSSIGTGSKIMVEIPVDDPP